MKPSVWNGRRNRKARIPKRVKNRGDAHLRRARHRLFAEGVLSTNGDLIKIEGSRDLEMTAAEAARIGHELIRLARICGWIDPEEDDGK